MKLVRDGLNGGRFQWKYYQDKPGYPTYWYDYGPSFMTRKAALEYMENVDLSGA